MEPSEKSIATRTRGLRSFNLASISGVDGVVLSKVRATSYMVAKQTLTQEEARYWTAMMWSVAPLPEAFRPNAGGA